MLELLFQLRADSGTQHSLWLDSVPISFPPRGIISENFFLGEGELCQHTELLCASVSLCTMGRIALLHGALVTTLQMETGGGQRSAEIQMH